MSDVQSPVSVNAPPSSPSITVREDKGVGPDTSELALTVTDLRKAFKSPAGETIAVLRGVSFSANAGETLAIRGASGVGKSTLLHLIGGLESVDSGRVTLGQLAIGEVDPVTMARFRNAEIGFVFQFHHLLPDLSALENVALPLMIGRIHRTEALYRAKQALAGVGLGDRLTHHVGNLSGGEQQRVAVCRALIKGPSLVLADEPTGNLDRAAGDEIGESLLSYARNHQKIVILATHTTSLARRCDRIMLLKDGRLHPE